MSPVSRNSFTLPENLQQAMAQLLLKHGTHLNDSRRLAEAVLRMSDFYIDQPEKSTPWKESWCQIAQLAYFLPLNFLRAQAVYQEALARQFPVASEILDFGSGLGAGSLPWLPTYSGEVHFAENSTEAQYLHQSLLHELNLQEEKQNGRWTWSSEQKFHNETVKGDRKQGRTGIFSYSLTELSALPRWAFELDNLILIEPSTRQDGRKLLEARRHLIEDGFSMWAPCPHQMDCPLLENSKTDWCHDRIHISMPLWFQNMEKHLPMKNQTLTFSYILASRKPASTTTQWRSVGDQLIEKGKTRQMICRGPEREFLAWLQRYGPAPEIPRGVLLDPPESFEIKSSEIREIRTQPV